MNNQADIQGHFELRRCILETLYGFFREYPYGLAELHLFQEQCQCSPEELNWNIVYLEKCGFVDLDKSMDCPPYVSCTATITAQGIDLVENPAQFGNKFPLHQDP
jgi:hypothetical protein